MRSKPSNDITSTTSLTQDSRAKRSHETADGSMVALMATILPVAVFVMIL